MSKYKICHITTVHVRYDTRIFWKLCRSLSKHYDVYLIVADGKGNEQKDGVTILDAGIKGRIKSLISGQPHVRKIVKSLKADLYHFHDPEILPFALHMIKRGYKFIYDVHEDLPLDIYNKPKIPSLVRPILSYCIKKFEYYAVSRMTYTITVTDEIKRKLLNASNRVSVVKNYPDLEMFLNDEGDLAKEGKTLCYLGLLNKSRGILELLDVVNDLNVILNLGGRFSEAVFEEQCKAQPGWKYTNFLGFVSQQDSLRVMKSSSVGMMLHHPNKAYSHAIPIKLLEYMACGIPVIVSDYPICNEIIGDVNCGFMVNVFDKTEITRLVKLLLDNPNLAQEMGDNGKKAILEKYNWQVECDRLVQLYDTILN